VSSSLKRIFKNGLTVARTEYNSHYTQSLLAYLQGYSPISLQSGVF